jgi:G3E family GTPase
MLLTGFLGSGKTTLLNAWLRTTELANAAVIVNEFGEVGIDHALIASSNDNTIELSTGCLCCTVGGDLVDTLRNLTVKRSKGEVRAFDRLVIETTGLADPAPVIQALMTFPVARRYRLRQVVTTVDAVHGLSTLDRHPEALKQAAVADEIVMTKTELAGDSVGALAKRLHALNPGAHLHSSSLADMPMPNRLITADIYDLASKNADVADWLNAAAYAGDRHADGDEPGHRQHQHDVNRHDAEITSFCLEYSRPLVWEHVANWLDALVIAHGDDLLRVKGILDIAGRDKPIVVHAVQRLFHPPVMLPGWQSDEHRSQLVFITRGLSRAYVCDVLESIRGSATSSQHAGSG